MGCQPRTCLVEEKYGDLLQDFHPSLNRHNYLCQLLNLHGVNDVIWTEVHTSVPFVPEPSAFETQTAVGKLKGHEDVGADQIPSQLIQAGDNKS
jgi:hypothetical protein